MAVVVLVPGGSWREANPEGFRPLGDALATAGLAAVTITYGTDGTGAHFPRPMDDVTCAIGFAAEQAPGVPVVVVGHSAGANLALLAGLHPDQGDATCPHAHVPASGVVGLAGPYDVGGSGIGRNLFGVDEPADAALWRDGDPFTWAEERADVPVLLVHGQSDDLVPVSFTERMADALEAGGHEVQVELVPDAGHNDVFRPEVLADTLAAWLASSVLGG
jgi:acetyl esterase/lipase